MNDDELLNLMGRLRVREARQQKLQSLLDHIVERMRQFLDQGGVCTRAEHQEVSDLIAEAQVLAEDLEASDRVT